MCLPEVPEHHILDPDMPSDQLREQSEIVEAVVTLRRSWIHLQFQVIDRYRQAQTAANNDDDDNGSMSDSRPDWAL